MRSVHRVFQRLASFETGQLGRYDLGRGAGMRVAPIACSACLHREGTETHEADAFAILQRRRDGVGDGIQGAASSGLRQVSRGGDGFNQFSFVHGRFLLAF
jgi:hypothetical protein